MQRRLAVVALQVVDERVFPRGLAPAEEVGDHHLQQDRRDDHHRHTGPRTELSGAWREFSAEAESAGEPLGAGSFEEFVSDTATDLYLHLR